MSPGLSSAWESATYLNNISNVRRYTQSFGNTNYTVNDTLWALFVQDDYRLRRHLMVHMGVRYEQQTITDSGKDWRKCVFHIVSTGQGVEG